jgi:hypothetical protein
MIKQAKKVLRPGNGVGAPQVWLLGMPKVSRTAVNLPVRFRKRCADATRDSVTDVRMRRSICDARQIFAHNPEHASFRATKLSMLASAHHCRSRDNAVSRRRQRQTYEVHDQSLSEGLDSEEKHCYWVACARRSAARDQAERLMRRDAHANVR